MTTTTRHRPGVGVWLSVPRITARASIVLVLFAGASTGAQAQRPAGRPNPMDSIARLPGYRPAYDTTPLLPAARIAKLPVGPRRSWEAYLARSRAAYTRDTLAMRAELTVAKKATMARAPYAHDFSVKPWMTDAWFRGDSAQRIAGIILSFQAPNGGWSKHVDFSVHSRMPGESYFAESDRWEWIATIDNDQTTEEMHFLALADRARRDARYEQAFVRGLDYLLAAQYPNGCWPQVYPLEGSYHDAVTFNDDAIANVMQLLREIADRKYGYVPAAERARADSASDHGLACILDAQIVTDGPRAAWAQQNDPITLVAASARSYELASLASLESAHILDFLMQVPAPSPRVVVAVHAAAAWLELARLHGWAYDTAGGLRAARGAPPVWARMYEIGTNRPIFSNRDGIKLYDWNRLTDRRHGYQWYTYAPAYTLARFRSWAREHPLPASSQ